MKEMEAIRLRCQRTYLNKRRCQNWTFRGGGVCRWHYILYRTQEWYRKIPGLVRSHLELHATFFLTLGLLSLRQYSITTEMIWLLASMFSLGAALCLLADSIMVLNYPLSQFTVWAKLLAAGKVLMMVVGAASALIMYIRPDVIQPVTGLTPRLGELAPRLFLAVTILLTLFVLKGFIKRILCYTIPGVNGLFILCVVLGAFGVFKPLLLQLPALSTITSNEFWQAATASSDNAVVMLTAGIIFSLEYLVSDVMLRVRLPKKLYATTLWLPFVMQLATIPISLLASRYLLVWSGVSGVFPFISLAVVLSIPLCVISMKMIIGRYLKRAASELKNSEGDRLTG